MGNRHYSLTGCWKKKVFDNIDGYGTEEQSIHFMNETSQQHNGLWNLKEEDAIETV